MNTLTTIAENKPILISRQYKSTPLPEALKDISNAADDITINFIYNNLEDYSVTCSFRDKNQIQAIYEVIGLYPIKVRITGNTAYVEPIIKHDGMMRGRLLDENGKPIEYANVRLFSCSDSTFITGGVSNEDGNFAIPVTNDRYTVKVSCLGYIPFSREYSSGNIGDIRMQSNSLTLKEVTVTRRQVVIDGDKIISYPTELQVKHSFDIYTFLNQQPLPGVFVDPINHSIVVSGGSPIILIDGIQRTIRELAAIQPKDILRVEFQQDLPAKYINSGASGLINIILKERKDGGSFYSNIRSAVTTGFVDGTVGGTYNQGKSEFSYGYTYSLRAYDKWKNDHYEKLYSPDFSVEFNQRGLNSFMRYNTNVFDLGYTYRHDKSTIFVSKFTADLLNSARNIGNNVSDPLIDEYFRREKIHGKNYNYTIDLYLQKQWDEDKYLEVQAKGYLSNNNRARTIIDTFENNEPDIYKTDVESKYKGGIVAASYIQTVSKNVSLTAGVNTSYGETDNTYLADYTKFKNKTANGNAYMGLSGRIGKSSFNISSYLQYQHQNNHIEKGSELNNITNVWLRFLINDNSFTNFSINYYTNTPTLSDKTVYLQQQNNYLFISGNPDLKKTHNINADQRYYYGIGKFWGQIQINERYTKNTFNDNVIYNGNKTFTIIPSNGKYSLRIMPSLFVGVNEIFNKHFSANVAFYFIHDQFHADYIDLYKNSTSIDLTLNSYFGKWNIGASFRKTGKFLNGTHYSSEENLESIWAGFYLNKHISLHASLMYFITKEGTKYKSTDYHPTRFYTDYTTIKNNNCMFTIGFRYNVNFGRIFKKTNRSLNENVPKADVKIAE